VFRPICLDGKGKEKEDDGNVEEILQGYRSRPYMESVFEGDSGHSQRCPCGYGHHHNRVREVSKFSAEKSPFFVNALSEQDHIKCFKNHIPSLTCFFLEGGRCGGYAIGYAIDFPRRSAETVAGLRAEKKRPQLCVRPVVVCSWRSVRIREKCSRVVFEPT